MNKLRSFFLICSFLIGLTISNLFASSYVVETSRGPQVVEIPSGYTEVEAFLEMSKLYLEERFDLEDIQADVEVLLDSIEQYKRDVKKLDDDKNTLIADYKDLEKLYKKQNKLQIFQPSIMLGTQYSEDVMNAHVFIGGTLFEKVSVHAMLSYPLAIGIAVGVQF